MKRLMLALALIIGAVAPAAAEPAARVALHIDENDPQRMKMALNNAANIHKHYAARGEEVAIAIVANGPGLHMFRSDTSPVIDRIEMMSLENPNISFEACGNTHRVMSEREGASPDLLPEAAMVPSGAVRLMELQGEGWAYLRP